MVVIVIHSKKHHRSFTFSINEHGMKKLYFYQVSVDGLSDRLSEQMEFSSNWTIREIIRQIFLKLTLCCNKNSEKYKDLLESFEYYDFLVESLIEGSSEELGKLMF